MAKKAIVFIANGSEEIEALTPVDYLRRAGVEVTLTGVESHATGDGAQYVECSHGVRVMVDCDVAALSGAASDADAVVVPGGMPGATNIAASAAACGIVRAANASGRLVCAICAAPAVVLPATGALDGKRWTCYPGMESEAGAHAERYQSGVPFVHDANLITGRGPGAAEQWAMEIVRTLCGDAVAQKVHDGSMQR